MNFEVKRNIKNRWKIDDTSFVNAITSSEETRHEAVVEKLHAMAVERQLLLTLKKKYSHKRFSFLAIILF